MEDLDLPHPVIRSNYGNGLQYVRDDRLLRTGPGTHKVCDYGGQQRRRQPAPPPGPHVPDHRQLSLARLQHEHWSLGRIDALLASSCSSTSTWLTSRLSGKGRLRSLSEFAGSEF